ncbi:MAG: lipoprotein NlpD [Glaciecola sp.]|jgi:lipoprotein NlpD
MQTLHERTIQSPLIVGLVAISFVFLSSCSGRSQPAPVVSLNTSVTKQNNLTEIEGETYQVQKGDTLFAVAFYSGNDYRDLASYNNLQAPYNIFPGQVLKLVPAPAQNNSNKNKPISGNTDRTAKVVVDPKNTQAYGESEGKINHRSIEKTPKTSKNPVNTVAWIWPATGKSTSAVVGSDGTNRGVDIKGGLYSPIYAAASGKVVYAGNALKGYGNLVIIKHDNNLLSAYAHNDTILVGEQSYVKQGQKIATMGRTDSSDVMLHFEIRRKGKSLDPFKFLPKQ